MKDAHRFCVVRFNGRGYDHGKYFETREAVDQAIDAAMEEERRQKGQDYCGVTWFIHFRDRFDAGYRHMGSRSI